MKAKHLTNIIGLAIIGGTAFLASGCPKKATPVVFSSGTAVETTPPTVSTAPTLQAVAGGETHSATTTWIELKDCTYDNRAQFFAGLEKLEAQVDQQMRDLNAKRATMSSTVDTKEWDFAMNEMEDARAYLKSTGEELRKANPETWNQLKDKVGQAWVRTQDAYAKVKNSTTT